MKLVLRIILITIYAIIAGLLLGAVGMMCGSVLARIIIPRPNVHVMEGLEYVVFGTLIGAAIGVIGVIVFAVRSWPKSTVSPVERSE